MTVGPISPKLLKLSWPLVVGNLLQTFYHLADMFWVGRVGSDSVAAVSLMFPTVFLFISVALGINAAAVAVISQHIGAGNERRAEQAVAQSMLLALAAAVTLSMVGYAIRHPLVALIGAEGRVYTEAIAYIEVMFLALPFTFLFFIFRAGLRAAGDTKTAMWLVVISAGLNVVIDPFFILGWGPFPEMGTRGAAVATLIARALAAAAGLAILLHGGWGIRLRIGDLRPDWDGLRRLFHVGYPAALDGLTRSLAAVVFAALVARFGTAPTAAYGIGIRLMSVSWTVSGAVGQAAATGVGQNLGADHPERAARVTWVGTAATMAILGAASVLVVAFPDVAMRIFVDDQSVIDEGVTFLRIIAPFWLFFGGLMVIQGGLRGAGSTRAAFVLSLLSRWAFRLPVALVLAYYLAWGPEGLWWSFSFSAVASFIVGVLWFKRGTWAKGVVEDDDDAEGTDGAARTRSDGTTRTGSDGTAEVGSDGGDDRPSEFGKG